VNVSVEFNDGPKVRIAEFDVEVSIEMPGFNPDNESVLVPVPFKAVKALDWSEPPFVVVNEIAPDVDPP
jgi:hypothetical protein